MILYKLIRLKLIYFFFSSTFFELPLSYISQKMIVPAKNKLMLCGKEIDFPKYTIDIEIDNIFLTLVTIDTVSGPYLLKKINRTD